MPRQKKTSKGFNQKKKKKDITFAYQQNMAEVKKKLEMPWEAGRTSGCCLQVSWIRDDGGTEQDCGNWYGKKDNWPEKDQKNRLTGLGLVTGWIGGKRRGKNYLLFPDS